MGNETQISNPRAPPLRHRSPPSPLNLDHDALIDLNDRGMILDTAATNLPPKRSLKRKRRTFQYVSRHFAQTKACMKADGGRPTKRRRRTLRVQDNRECDLVSKNGSKVVAPQQSDGPSWLEDDHHDPNAVAKCLKAPTPGELETKMMTATTAATPALAPWQRVLAAPTHERPEVFTRLLYGIDIDNLSSDSELTDVPNDIGPDPFDGELDVAKQDHAAARKSTRKSGKKRPEVVAAKETKVQPAKQKSRTGFTKSPYFPHAHKHRPTFLSTLPFPPLDLERFGLMQERLCHDPFRLLLATIFLNKTPGSRAMPIFFRLMERYPTPQALAGAEQSDVTGIIHELGFQNQRARKCIAMAQRWLQHPPKKGRRWRKLGYPTKSDGKDIKADEVVGDDDPRIAWEISHLPGLGPYSHDSWRMFCRDELRGLATSYNAEGANRTHDDQPFEPEWKRVLPTDKELRAWMTWMWMKEGWVWNKETGERTRASDELMELAKGKGNVVLENEANTLHVQPLAQSTSMSFGFATPVEKDVKVEAPAGDFMPRRA